MDCDYLVVGTGPARSVLSWNLKTVQSDFNR